MKHRAIVMVPRVVELVSDDVEKELREYMAAQPQIPSPDSTSGFYSARVLELRISAPTAALPPLPEVA